MREDYIEALDKMFPDGYGIAYTCPDSQIRWAHYNPHNDPLLFKFYDFAKENNAEDKS